MKFVRCNQTGCLLTAVMILSLITSILAVAGVAATMASMKVSKNSQGLIHFQSSIASIKNLLSHPKGCLSALGTLDYAPLLSQNVSQLTDIGLFQNAMLADIVSPNKNVTYTAATLKENVVADRQILSNQTTVLMDLSIDAKKNIYLGTSKLKREVIPMYFTLDNQAKLLSCGLRKVANVGTTSACINTSGNFKLLDVFADGTINPFTDGDALLLAATGAPLTAFIPSGNNRANPLAYIQSISPQLDIDGNGVFDSNDAYMILMYEFGLPPTSVVSRKASNATRSDFEIMAYLDQIATTVVPCTALQLQ